MARQADPFMGHRLSLPPAPGAGRRRTIWHRTWGLGAALLGITALLLGPVGLAAVPDLIQDEKAFGAAATCTALSPSHDDCLRSFDRP